MRQHAWKVLDRAYAAGVRYFDAARSYVEACGASTTRRTGRGTRTGCIMGRERQLLLDDVRREAAVVTAFAAATSAIVSHDVAIEWDRLSLSRTCISD